jgi:hypothetical protein
VEALEGRNEVTQSEEMKIWLLTPKSRENFIGFRNPGDKYFLKNKFFDI